MAEQFAKRRPGAPTQYFQREADGLRWLAAAHGAPVPGVVHVGADHLVMDRIATAAPSANDARRFGADLAVTHQAGASAFGAAPPSDLPDGHGFIADLVLPYGEWHSFGVFYADARIRPYLEMVRDQLTAAAHDVFGELVERLHSEDPVLVGPAEPPARIHGDLWSGNVVWGPDAANRVRGWLIDPAAHGGHRETDLAMLALFGAPHLGDIVAGYEQRHPLARGWRERVALHQVHPLLVHAVLFGGGYLRQAVDAARGALQSCGIGN